jgi:hypothetical protein
MLGGDCKNWEPEPVATTTARLSEGTRKPSKGVGEEGERELQPGGGRPFIAPKWAVYAAEKIVKLKTLVEEKRRSKLK